jgi:hypothetical protein
MSAVDTSIVIFIHSLLLLLIHQILVIEDAASTVVQSEVGVGTVLLEARISFDVPTKKRTLENSQAAKQYSTALAEWSDRKYSRQSKKRHAAYQRRRTRREEAIERGDPVPEGGWPSIYDGADSEESDDEEELGPEPKKPELTRCAMDHHTLGEIQNAFVADPFEALNALAGNSHYSYPMPDIYNLVVQGSVQCSNPAGLTDTTTARAFASVRSLCHQKRAAVNMEAPDASLWTELVRQPPRVLRIVWSFASLKKMPLSAYSLAALEEEMEVKGSSVGTVGEIKSSVETVKNEDSSFVVFTKALLEDSKKSRNIAAFKEEQKYYQERKARNIQALTARTVRRFERQKTKCENRGVPFVPKVRSKIAREALAQVMNGSSAATKKSVTDGKKADNDDNDGGDDEGADETDNESDEDGDGAEEEEEEKAEKEPNHLDPSQLSFDFAASPLTEDPRTGFVQVTLTVRLAAGAFSAGRRKDKALALLKQKDLRDLTRKGFMHSVKNSCDTWRPRFNSDKTKDHWQDRSPNPIAKLLGKAFPERWGVDEESPVVSDNTQLSVLVGLCI